MSDNFRRAPRKQIALDNRKFRLDAPNGKGKQANLSLQLVNNNPRFVMYTNDPDDKQNDNGRIQAALDAWTFYAFLELLEKAISSTEKFGEKIANKNFIWPNGKRSEEPVEVSSLLVGRDEDGVIWISVSAKNRPQIKFPFTNPNFHNFFHRNGNQYTQGEVSEIYAKAYVKLMRELLGHLLVTEWVEPPPPKQKGQYGNNNNQNQQQNNQRQYGNQNSDGNDGGGGGDDFDDDTPW